MTLLLNITLAVYYEPKMMNEGMCPVFFHYVNESVNPDINHELIITTGILGSIYTILVIWMLAEYFTITWPHFVLPKFLYKNKVSKFMQRWSCLSWIARCNNNYYIQHYEKLHITLQNEASTKVWVDIFQCEHFWCKEYVPNDVAGDCLFTAVLHWLLLLHHVSSHYHWQWHPTERSAVCHQEL